jgi:SAM-dependent methyltransferase
MYLKNRTGFFSEKLTVLEIAPIDSLQNIFRNLKNLTYVSADLTSPIAMMKMDITETGQPDNRYDCIICYHVLEHIPDDEKAMRELFRILKPGGWAIVQSPVEYGREKTFEDPAIVTPEQREKSFGQHDHVRIYGRDYQERLTKAGFTVLPDDYAQTLTEHEVKRYSILTSEGPIYLCVKPNR